MNERIKQLAEQVVGPSRLHGGEFALFGDQQVEQFAILIIDECASLAENGFFDDLDGQEICDGIKNHFGV
jgi:hypothetical protein